MTPLCACEHSDTAHDLNPKGVRTACSITTRAGHCPCTRFQHAFDQTRQTVVTVTPTRK